MIITFTFGKHRGRTVGSVWRDDPGYIRWVLNTPDMEIKYRRIYEACQQVASGKAEASPPPPPPRGQQLHFSDTETRFMLKRCHPDTCRDKDQLIATEIVRKLALTLKGTQ